MLVVESSDLYETERMYCSEVCTHLSKFLKKCQDDPQYAIEKKPWHNRKPNSGRPFNEAIEISIPEKIKEQIANSQRPWIGRTEEGET